MNMKITICASINFTNEIGQVAEVLKAAGHEIVIPETSGMILRKEVTLGQIVEEKHTGEFVNRVIRQDSIARYYEKVKDCDAILVLNIDKKGIKNYIGGNTFLEIGFAHVLGKKIYLYNPIPEIEYYKDEIKSMQPVILNRDLKQIK